MIVNTNFKKGDKISCIIGFIICNLDEPTSNFRMGLSVPGLLIDYLLFIICFSNYSVAI